MRTLLSVPVGAVIDFAGSAAPAGYLECDGSAVSRTGYAALFAAIGTAWGAGDGSTTFNLPDLRGRTTIGTGTGTAGGATQHDFASLGGDERMQSHSHAHPRPVLQYCNTGGSLKPASGTSWRGSDQLDTNYVNSAGGGSSQNMQPFATVRKLIRAA